MLEFLEQFFDFLKDAKLLRGLIIWLITFILNYYLFRKDTDIWIISTYSGKSIPTKNHINNAIHSLIFRNRKDYIIMDQDLNSKWYTNDTLDTFITENTSQIKKLSNSNNVLSLFLFAHMPLIVYLGFKIWKSKKVELYHKLRTEDKNEWKWKNIIFKNIYKNKWEYIINKNLDDSKKDVILDIDISFPIHWKDLIDYTNKSYYRIELIWKDNELIRNSFLRYKYQLTEFYNIVEKAFYEIEEKLWSNCNIHLFLTTPNPFSFIIWQQIHINWPKVLVYDKNNEWNYVVMKIIN